MKEVCDAIVFRLWTVETGTWKVHSNGWSTNRISRAFKPLWKLQESSRWSIYSSSWSFWRACTRLTKVERSLTTNPAKGGQKGRCVMSAKWSSVVMLGIIWALALVFIYIIHSPETTGLCISGAVFITLVNACGALIRIFCFDDWRVNIAPHKDTNITVSFFILAILWYNIGTNKRIA